MLAKSLLISLAALSVVACSDGQQHDAPQGGAGTANAGAPNSAAGTAGALGVSGGTAVGGVGNQTGDSALFVPADITVVPRVGINSVFVVVALTLRPVSGGAELYAAVKNEGDGPVCNASFSVDLLDKDDQILSTGISGLMVRRYYHLVDDESTIAGCLEAGDVSMVAIKNLALDAPLEDVRRVVYQSGYWGLKIVPITGVTLSDVKAVTSGADVAYTGTLNNALETALTHPTVAIFPTNSVGRPLDVAYGGTMVELPPAASWTFETDTVSEAGVAFDAYPMGGP